MCGLFICVVCLYVWFVYVWFAAALTCVFVCHVFYLRHIGFYMCVVCIYIYIYINRYYICGVFIYVVCIYAWFDYVCGLRQQ